jgi:hypothetical protein
MSIPIKGIGPKYINKSVMVDEAVWSALIERRVNMSELVRQHLEETLRTLVSQETSAVQDARAGMIKRSPKAKR